MALQTGEPTGHLARRGLIAGSRLFGLILLVAAVLKAGSPGLATASLAWTGLAVGARHFVVVAGSALEVLVGGALLWFPRRRSAMVCGGVLAAGLLIAHTAMANRDCGCFGRLPVPPWLTIASLALGVLTTGGCYLFGHGSRSAAAKISRVRLTAIAMIASGVLAWGVATPPPDGAAQQNALARELQARGVDDGNLVVVGAWGCSHCADAVARLQAQGNERIWFVATEADAAEPRLVPELPSVTIDEEQWWSLVGAAPPVVLQWHDGALREFPLTGSVGASR